MFPINPIADESNSVVQNVAHRKAITLNVLIQSVRTKVDKGIKAVSDHRCGAGLQLNGLQAVIGNEIQEK